MGFLKSSHKEVFIICGNCIEVMKGLKNNSIDLVLTDPPFMISSELKI